jgi:aryl-alcohol dehydrogenase-like predicted oxidoreductase
VTYRRLGRSDLEISTIGYGCWGIAGGPMWGPQNETESVRALQAACDEGVNFFDTAEAYGAGYSEEVVGKALADRRDAVIIASKVLPANLTPDALRHSCENSLRRLRTDYIDLYQLHWPEPSVPADEVVATLEELRAEGKIRLAGVSNFGPVDLERYPEETFVSNQVAYSLLFRAVENAVIPATRERGMSLITYSSLLHGILGGDYTAADQVPPARARTRHFSADRDETRHGEPGHERLVFETLARINELAREAGLETRAMAIRWIADRPGVTSVLIGSRTVRQARANVALGEGPLDPGISEKLEEITAPLKEAMGPNPDMWQTDSRIHW